MRTQLKRKSRLTRRKLHKEVPRMNDVCSVVDFTPPRVHAREFSSPPRRKVRFSPEPASPPPALRSIHSPEPVTSLMSPEPSRLSPPSPEPSPEPLSLIRTPMTSPEPSTSPSACQPRTIHLQTESWSWNALRNIKWLRQRCRLSHRQRPTIILRHAPMCQIFVTIMYRHRQHRYHQTIVSRQLTIHLHVRSEKPCMTPDELLSAVSNENADYTSGIS